MIDVPDSSKVLFALGRPGCGKSTAARHIQACLETQKPEKWSVTRIKDYEILYEMFEQDRNIKDTSRRRFCEAIVEGYGVRGFDVLDFIVLDEALEKTAQKISSCLKEASSPSQKSLTIVEFARDNYKDVFEKLATYLDRTLGPNKGRDLLQQSFYLFVEAPLRDCIQRIHERVKLPIKEDNHLVSDSILRSYYEDDGVAYLRGDLKRDYSIDQRQVKILENKGSQGAFLKEVASFLNETLLDKVPVR